MRPTILLQTLCMSHFTVVFKDDELCQQNYDLDIRNKLCCVRVLSVRGTPDPTVYVCSLFASSTAKNSRPFAIWRRK